MKTTVIILCAMAISLHARAEASSERQVHRYAYNWQLHEQLVDEQFEKTCKPDVLSAERKTIEVFLPKERADAYMKHFEAGMRSRTGAIMLEGGNQRWLELAHEKGFQAKMIFRHGYSEGLKKSAENPDVMRAIK